MSQITIPSLIADVHTHLYDSLFDDDVEQVIQRAVAQNVQKIIVANENFETMPKLLQLCKQYPSIVKPCLGVHPCCIESEEQIDQMIKLIETTYYDQIVGIGEVGLDFTPKILQDQLKRVTDKSIQTVDDLKQLQRTAFLKFVKLANDLQLPMNVHSRSAGRPLIETLLATPAQKGVLLHCFDGSEKVAKKVFNVPGFYFSVPANIVRSEQLQKLVKSIPLQQLMLETDSPALVPDLNSENKRNEPVNVVLSVQMIAQIKNVSVEEVCKVTTENAKQLFPRLFLN